MKRPKKCRFINLAEQLTRQNDVVSTTMDSMLKFVADSNSIESRSDFDEIRKTVEQMNELNPGIATQENDNSGLRPPKLACRKASTRPIEENL